MVVAWPSSGTGERSRRPPNAGGAADLNETPTADQGRLRDDSLARAHGGR
jgi:hypothetical protein